MVIKETNPINDVWNSNSILIDGLKYNDGAELLVNVNGNRNGNISINHVDVSKTKQPVKFGEGVKENAVKVDLTK